MVEDGQHFCEESNNMFVIVNEYEHLASIFKVIEEITSDNLEYFVVNEERSRYTKFVQSFQSILNILSPLQMSLDVITGCCAKFDVKPTCKGNGYRSIVNIVESCLNQTISLSEQVQRNRDKLFFRSYQMYAELDSYAQVLARLLTIVQFATVLLDNSEVRCLFPKDTPKVNGIIEDMMDDFNDMSRECFYGRSFGFQYALTVRQSLQVVGVAMAAYGDGYIRHTDTLSRAVSSVIHSGKYLIDPELRAKRITELTQGIDINFCKAFWSLPEEYGVQHAPLLVCPAMDVNLEFTIPSDDLTIKTLDGNSIDVKLPPCTGKQVGVKARLLSFVWRDGQIHNVWKNSKSYGPLGPKPRQRSRYLMIHCHGGGFVSQSSKSHEIYLRHWAKELRIPILSIDYSLSPEAVFPQALNEIFFAYVWALNNFKKLGTTGDKIVFTGDSAGANLVTAVTLKAIMSNIRLPDCLVVAYPPYRVQYYPSPSRILCLMDPLLPLGVLKSCIQAYAGDIKAGKNIPRNVDLLKQTSNLYNPFALDVGEDHWDVSHSHNCGQFHSLSETNLDMIKYQLVPHHMQAEDDEYFSDCPLSDIDSCSTLDSDTGRIKRTSSYGNVIKRTLSEDIIATKKSCRKTLEDNTEKKEMRKKTSVESVGSNSSLFVSLKSQVSSQVFDLTSRVSSKVFDDIKSSVTQQIPSNVLDVSTKMFDDIKTGFTNYLYDKRGSNNTQQQQQQQSLGESQLEQLDNMTVSNISPRKRALDKSDVVESKDKQKFSICKECLYPSNNCNCNMKWTGKVMTPQKRLLDRYGSRHSLSGRCCTFTMSTAACDRESILNTKNISNIEHCNEGCDNKTKKNSVGACSYGLTTIKPEVSFKMVNDARMMEHMDTSGGKETSTCAVIDDTCLDFRNPLMSPIFASDALLKKMPPVSIFACSLDPLFDDSVEFIRKLQRLDKDAELHVLDRLPHGFLNFQVFSPEARDACDSLIACIKKSLNM